jgi:hypothetical protein
MLYSSKDGNTMKVSECLERLEKGEDPLELSIEKWRDISKGIDVNLWNKYRNCGLCARLDGCDGCLIYMDTGESMCRNTPYEEFQDHHSECSGCGTDGICEVGREIALNMVKYLESLRKYKGYCQDV